MTPPATILIVEDEPLIAMLLEDMLDMLGYRITGPFDTVAAALEQVEQGGFDLAILDVNLRGGEESWAIADALEARGLPFVIASGGSAGGPPERHRARPMLAKPYTLADVEKVVAEL